MRINDWNPDVCSTDVFGAEVVAGRSAGEVLESLTARGLVPSCIVVDFWLSREENGLSAVTRLRESAGGNPRILVVTGDLSRSEEHTSELQPLMRTSYAVFCW